MRVFITYARQEQAIIRQLAEKLRRAEFDVWFDERLLPGEDWESVLFKEVKNADAFIYALSPASIESKWCEREFNFAKELSKPIFPVKVQPITNIPSEIGAIQFANFENGISEVELTKLVRALARILTDDDEKNAKVPRDIETKIDRNWWTGVSSLTAEFSLRGRHIVEFRTKGTGVAFRIAVRVDGYEICNELSLPVGTWSHEFEIEEQECVINFGMFFWGWSLDFLVNGYKVGWNL